MKTYLGDSVYAKFDGFSIILTTENGLPNDPSNKIILEPQVLHALLAFKVRIDSMLKRTHDRPEQDQQEE